MKTDPNDLAYPHHAVWDNDKPEIGWISDGLTKRELFAAMALQGLKSNPERGEGFDETARKAVRYADALIAELNKETP